MKSVNLINAKKFLLDYANLSQNLIFNQNNFLNEKKFNKILAKPQWGIPFILPKNIKYFTYPKNKKYFFKISKKKVLKKLFLSKNSLYGPFLKFFAYGSEFCSNVKIKNKYKLQVLKFINENKKLLNKIKLLKKKNKIIGAFQSRNIPHLGHEALINKLLEKCDYVFINPVCGVKKKGDIKTEILRKSYNFLINKHYNSKLIFAPIYTNMFYAGPREALHHALLRQQLGFDYFIVGRDHAGSENNYNANHAIKIIKKYSQFFKINILTMSGAFYCKNLKKIILLPNKKCKKQDLINISGTNFRKCIIQNKIFKFARVDLQKYIHTIKGSIFY
jgi:sulfate adenylyltransferase